MVVVGHLQLLLAPALPTPALHPPLHLLEVQLCRLEPLVPRNLRPQLIGAVLERVVPDWLLTCTVPKQVLRLRPDLLPKVEAVVSAACLAVVHVGPILVGLCLRKLLVDQVLGFVIGGVAWVRLSLLALAVGAVKLCALSDVALVAGLPVLGACLKHVEATAVARLSCLFGLSCVVWL